MKNKINFLLNDIHIEAELNPATALLDYLRSLKLTGTKEGCKEGDCGACTVICGKIDNDKIIYRTINSCLVPVMNINGTHIVTIEGLNNFSGQLTPIQKTFIKEGASQCGFCTPGFIVSLTCYFLSQKYLKDTGIIDSMDGNICRCTGHNSIIRAAEIIYSDHKDIPEDYDKKIKYLIDKNIIPEYFLYVEEKLLKIKSEVRYENNDYGNPKYFIAGGTDLFVQKPDEMLYSENSFLIKPNSDDLIYENVGYCFVNANSTVSDILESSLIRKYFPKAYEFSKLFGSTPIRNSATLGGNINNASPIGDMTAFFLALDSELVLSDGKSERNISLKEFYTGYKKTVRKNIEFVSFLKFKIPESEYYFNFEKVSKRTYLDIASVNTALYLELNENMISKINISAGGVFEIPKYLLLTSEFLTGKKIEPVIIREAIIIAEKEISPISDARGSENYKRLLLKRLIFAHFIKLFPELINIKETV